MEKLIVDEKTGLKYELVDGVYLIADEDEPKRKPIGPWGMRHLKYICKYRQAFYTNLLITGRLNDYLFNLNEEAEERFLRIVKELAEKEGITESLKAKDPMLWVRKMNNFRNTAMEIISDELIYR